MPAMRRVDHENTQARCGGNTLRYAHFVNLRLQISSARTLGDAVEYKLSEGVIADMEAQIAAAENDRQQRASEGVEAHFKLRARSIGRLRSNRALRLPFWFLMPFR